MEISHLVIAVLFLVLADLIIRISLKKNAEKKLKKKREETLSINVLRDYSHESRTLKRVEVENPKARILAVDDETLILDNYRKILVLNGFSVDTVETGKEAIVLVQKNNYDFVYLDLKMPDMDGVDICKSIKNIKKNTDIIIITGYGSIETAVDTIKYGAMDYIQKPFTDDELIKISDKLLRQRNNRNRKK